MVFNKYFWQNLWYEQISSRINPRQKWLTSKIPRTWSDADYLIELCVFESLIYWWENDNGESTTKYQFTTEDHDISDERRETYKEIYNRLSAAYDWAKNRHKAREAYDEMWMTHYSKFSAPNTNRDKLMEFSKIEREMEEKDTFFLKEIVELRKYMWT